MLELNTTCGTLQDGLKIVFADIRGISRTIIETLTWRNCEIGLESLSDVVNSNPENV